MLSTQSRNAGFLGLWHDPVAPIGVIPFQPKDPAPDGVPYSNTNKGLPASDLMIDLFQAQRDALKKSGHLNAVSGKEIDDWCTMTQELKEGGWLSSIPTCLADLDFEHGTCWSMSTLLRTSP
jgi:hypothetical protein